MSHGLASCSEWTGVLLSVVLEEVGVEPDAKWIIAEGGDACNMQRSLPLDKCRDDVLLAFGQNGEAIRPEQGYPVRLMVPGWEGNINVKWLRRLKVTDQPVMARDETSKYTDLLANGKARLFSFPMEAKSVITFPSGGQTLSGAGPYEISGLAWSGRGMIDRVEVSTDGGATWRDSGLQEPRHRFAFTRFRLPWRWDGSETDDPVEGERRLGLRPTDGRGADRVAGPQLELPQQRHQGLEGCGRRECVECVGQGCCVERGCRVCLAGCCAVR